MALTYVAPSILALVSIFHIILESSELPHLHLARQPNWTSMLHLQRGLLETSPVCFVEVCCCAGCASATHFHAHLTLIMSRNIGTLGPMIMFIALPCWHLVVATGCGRSDDCGVDRQMACWGISSLVSSSFITLVISLSSRTRGARRTICLLPDSGENVHFCKSPKPCCNPPDALGGAHEIYLSNVRKTRRQVRTVGLDFTRNVPRTGRVDAGG